MAAKIKKKDVKVKEVQGLPRDFGILYFFEGDSKRLAEAEGLLRAQKCKSLVVVYGKTEPEKALSNDERAVYIQHREKAKVSDFIGSKPEEWWVVYDDSCDWNLIKSVKSIEEETWAGSSLLTPSSVQLPENAKPGILSLLLKFLFLLKSAFFSPSTFRHAFWNLVFVRKQKLLQSIEQFGLSSAARMKNSLHLLNKPDGVFELFLTGKEPSYWKGTVQAFKNGVKDYSAWFFKIPFAVLKNRIPMEKAEKREAISRLSFAVIFLSALIGMPILSLDYGLTWDEPLQYEFAKDMYRYYTSFGEDKSVFDTSKGLWAPMQYYGSFFDLITVAFNDIFGIENEYDARHILNAIFGAIGVLFCGLTARILTGSWLAGLIALVLLLLSPMYFGHSMNNPKDIPFAVGFFGSVYFMIRLLKELPRPGFATLFLLVGSIAFSVSIRVGGFLIFFYLFCGFAIDWFGRLNKQEAGKSASLFLRYLLYFVGIFVFSWILGILFWPFALKDPIQNTYDALVKMSNFSFITSYENFEGKRTLMSAVPWYYTIKLMVIGTPLLILFGALIQVLRFVLNDRKAFWWNALLVLMFVFPIAYTAYKHSTLYNGWRHSIFIYGNLVLLAALGLYFLLANRHKLLRYGGVAIILIGGGNALWWMVKSHPNQYVYFNELTGGLKGAYGYYETDYYSNSVRQAVEWFVENELPKIGDKRVTILTNNEPLSSQYYMNKYTDKVDIVWTREYELTKKYADYSIFTSRTMAKTTLLEGYYPPKGTIHIVELDDVPLCAVVKHENHYMAEGYMETDSAHYAEAKELFWKAVEYDPGNDEAWRMLGLSMANISPQYADSALWALRKSIDILPENFIAYDITGMIFSSLNKHDTAVTMFEKAIFYKINYTNAHYNLGLSYFNLNNFLKASVSFENAIRYGGQQPMYYKLLGICMLNLNRLSEAQQYLTFSAQNSNDPEAYYYLGQAFELQGNTSSAQQMYQRAEELRAK
ncbi:MAG TPA: hypothetical protein DIW47_05150 [Bacteroidetes bacterium]|nr:hypothetical protein [Bacteroidota bacterium]